MSGDEFRRLVEQIEKYEEPLFAALVFTLALDQLDQEGKTNG